MYLLTVKCLLGFLAILGNCNLYSPIRFNRRDFSTHFMRYLLIMLTVLICSSFGKTDDEALVKNIDAQVKAYDSTFMSYKSEWLQQELQNFKKNYDLQDSGEEKERSRKGFEGRMNWLESTKEITGIYFNSADKTCSIHRESGADCIWGTVYKLNGKLVKLGFSAYDTYIRIYYKNDKVILYMDDETTSLACRTGLYYARYYFDGKKMISGNAEGPVSKMRKEHDNGERHFYNLYTSQDSILVVCGNAFVRESMYGFRMKIK
jgi:hypothetical protein